MQQQKMNQMLGKYEVYEIEEDERFTVYKIKNKGETKIDRILYVCSKLAIQDISKPFVYVGGFQSKFCKDNTYDADIIHIGDSTVLLLKDDNITRLFIYNKDHQKRNETKSVLEEILG